MNNQNHPSSKSFNVVKSKHSVKIIDSHWKHKVEQNPYHSSLAESILLKSFKIPLKSFKIPLSYIMVNLYRKLYGTKYVINIFKKNRTQILQTCPRGWKIYEKGTVYKLLQCYE